MLANLRGALLLATSNRSEAAVGYATMDGDTCGGLAPDRRHRQGVPAPLAALAGDARARRRARPLPALAAVNAQQPTAELRPRRRGARPTKPT